jgi:hypothetical protein
LITPGIQGPGILPTDIIEFKLPGCIKTEKDKEELQKLINDLVSATRKDCLNKFEMLLKNQNQSIEAFVKYMQR